jgi:hypothetical protein
MKKQQAREFFFEVWPVSSKKDYALVVIFVIITVINIFNGGRYEKNIYYISFFNFNINSGFS